MGHTKYPTLLSVVKTAIDLAHGNAEVEGRSSDSDENVTVERTRVSKASINNFQITTDGLKMFGSLSHHV